MFDTLEKMMLFGLGAAAMSRDKVSHFLDDMVKRGEVTAEEGRKLYDELMARAETERQNINERVRTQVRDMLTELGVPDRTQVALLEARIAALEHRIDELSARVPETETTEGAEVV